jgi:predicted transcriptional regulator
LNAGSPVLTTPCEIASRKYVPAIRASVAIVLVREYGLSAYRVAKLLGLTPAAVSNYLLGRRGGELVAVILGNKVLRRMVAELASKIAEGAIDDAPSLQKIVCRLCKELRKMSEGQHVDCAN